MAPRKKSERVKHLETVAKEKAKKEAEIAAKKLSKTQKTPAEIKKENDEKAKKAREAAQRKRDKKVAQLLSELKTCERHTAYYQEEIIKEEPRLDAVLKKIAEEEKTASVPKKRLAELTAKEMEEEGKLPKDKTLCRRCDVEFGDGDATPRVLACGHTLCQKCIRLGDTSKGKIQCPYDKKRTAVTRKNVETLPKNYAVLSFQMA